MENLLLTRQELPGFFALVSLLNGLVACGAYLLGYNPLLFAALAGITGAAAGFSNSANAKKEETR